MANVPVHLLRRFREQLLRMEYAEVNLWSDEDLKVAIFENGTSFIELLKWLLGELDNEIKEKLVSITREKLHDSIKDIIIGLGFCSSASANQFISGKVNLKKREEFCSHIIQLIELKRKKFTNGTAAIDPTPFDETLDQFLKFKVFKSFEESTYLKGKKKKTNNQSADISPSEKLGSILESTIKMQENITEAEEDIKKKRLELELKDDNITATEHLEQLLEERERKLEMLAEVSLSLQDLWKSVNEIYKSELQPLLPVEVMDPMEIPALEELSEQVDFFTKLQKDQETLEKCRKVIKDRYAVNLEEEWSVKNTESLPLLDLQEQVHHVVMGAQQLDKSNKRCQ